MAFAAPRQSDTTQQRRAHLGGMMLKRSSSHYSGGNDGGYSGGDGAEFGQWRVETVGSRVLLSPRATNGGISQHVLQAQGNDTYVDGERALRVQSDRCR